MRLNWINGHYSREEYSVLINEINKNLIVRSVKE